MTTEQQIKVLAELDGYVDIEIQHQLGSVFNPYGWMVGRIEASCCDDKVDVPKYLYSRDAIIPLIAKFFGTAEEPDTEFSTRFWDELDVINEFFDTGGATWMLMSTPAHLAEALLRTAGRWTDT